MKRRDFIKGAVVGGGFLSAGMVAGVGEAMAAMISARRRPSLHSI